MEGQEGDRDETDEAWMQEMNKRNNIEALKKFKAEMDQDTKLKSIMKKGDPATPTPAENKVDKAQADAKSSFSSIKKPQRGRENEYVKIKRGATGRGRRNPDGDPPSEIINKNHRIIEKRTRKPNIAKLNNTTLNSNDDGKSTVGRRDQGE